MTGIAYAMGQGGVAGQGAQGGFTSLVPLLLMFVIFYFLLIRPQQKKNKELRQMIDSLKKGDKIVTAGGIHGRITAVDDAVVTVEIADKVRIKLNRGNVAARIQSAPPVAESNEKKENSEPSAD